MYSQFRSVSYGRLILVTFGEPARKQTRAGIGGPLLRKTITLTSVLAAHLSDLLVLLVDLSLHPLELPEPCSNLPKTAMALRHSGVVVLVVVPAEEFLEHEYLEQRLGRT